MGPTRDMSTTTAVDDETRRCETDSNGAGRCDHGRDCHHRGDHGRDSNGGDEDMTRTRDKRLTWLGRGRANCQENMNGMYLRNLHNVQ
jgi:hypothetical protein